MALSTRSRVENAPSGKAMKPPCRFCQRSRWLLVITSLVMMAAVAALQLNAQV